jgi:hypothetical protein
MTQGISFVLNALNQDVTSILATIEKVAPDTLKYDATSVIEVTYSDVRSTFKFQTDSDDLTDISGTDIKYYVHSTHMGLDPSWNPMSDSVVQVKSGNDNWGRVATTGSNGETLADLSPSADYERHLADILFGTHFGVDLFTNETAIKDHLISESDGTVQTALTAAASMTISDNTDANLCRALMMQILENIPERFQDLSATFVEQSVPIQVGDSISYRIIVRAAADQEALTGVTNTRDEGQSLDITPTLKKLDKVYRIKFLVVADPV